MQEIDEVMKCLIQHECRDITTDVDLEVNNGYIARGGFGTIYSGRLRNGRAVVVKCLEALTNTSWTDENYDDNLKVTFRY